LLDLVSGVISADEYQMRERLLSKDIKIQESATKSKADYVEVSNRVAAENVYNFATTHGVDFTKAEKQPIIMEEIIIGGVRIGLYAQVSAHTNKKGIIHIGKDSFAVDVITNPIGKNIITKQTMSVNTSDVSVKNSYSITAFDVKTAVSTSTGLKGNNISISTTCIAAMGDGKFEVTFSAEIELDWPATLVVAGGVVFVYVGGVAGLIAYLKALGAGGAVPVLEKMLNAGAM